MNKLIEMGREQNTEAWLFSPGYSTEWNCYAKGKVNGMEFKIEAFADTPQGAIDEVYEKWERLVGRVPEFRPALEYTPPAVGDEIPF